MPCPTHDVLSTIPIIHNIWYDLEEKTTTEKRGDETGTLESGGRKPQGKTQGSPGWGTGVFRCGGAIRAGSFQTRCSGDPKDLAAGKNAAIQTMQSSTRAGSGIGSGEAGITGDTRSSGIPKPPGVSDGSGGGSARQSHPASQTDRAEVAVCDPVHSARERRRSGMGVERAAAAKSLQKDKANISEKRRDLSIHASARAHAEEKPFGIVALRAKRRGRIAAAVGGHGIPRPIARTDSDWIRAQMPDKRGALIKRYVSKFE